MYKSSANKQFSSTSGSRTLSFAWILLVAFFSVFLLANCDQQVLTEPTTYGEIIVDSPEVYRRERLVNDRFRQQAWLLKQLGEADDISFGVQVNTRQMSKDQAELEVTTAVGPVPTGSEQPSQEANSVGTSSPAATQPTSPSLSPTSVTPIEEFRDYLAYLEEVRNEIIETQLDDRHDLGGNTLYRLKFDTTIIPGDNTSAWAKIDIGLSHTFGEQEQEAAWESLYRDWVDVIRRDLRQEFRELLFKYQADQLTLKESVQLYAAGRKLLLRSGDAAITIAASVPDGEYTQEKFITILDLLRQQYQLPSNTDSVEEIIAKIIIDSVLTSAGEFTGLHHYIHVDSDRSKSSGAERIIVTATDDGREQFKKSLHGYSNAYAYVVTPKESVLRLNRASALQLESAFRAHLGLTQVAGNLQAGGGFSRKTQSLANLLERRPVVVGFSRPSNASSARFGWLIGPRPVSGSDGAFRFRHLPVQNALTAVVSVPAWWRRAKVKIDTTWLDKNGNSVPKETIIGNNKSGTSADKFSFEVRLPGDLATITSLLTANLEIGPKIATHLMTKKEIAVVAGQSARILIPGPNLWRSTVVTLGAQAAERITVLPDMEGIIAEFTKIDYPADWLDRRKPYENAALTVWTSEGVARLDKAVYIYDQNTSHSDSQPLESRRDFFPEPSDEFPASNTTETSFED